MCLYHPEMQLAIKINLKTGRGGGSLGNLQGPGQKQHSHEPQGFDVMEARFQTRSQ